ncbi:MAG: type B 50S ribosomal protein L31 [Bacteroidota bacterium]
MKKEGHPVYRDVIFKDISTDYAFKTRSTINTKETITWEDGKEYPLYKVEISSDSHPFFTGKQKLVDTAGRVDRFYSRYGKKKDKKS